MNFVLAAFLFCYRNPKRSASAAPGYRRFHCVAQFHTRDGRRSTLSLPPSFSARDLHADDYELRER